MFAILTYILTFDALLAPLGLYAGPNWDMDQIIMDSMRAKKYRET